MTPETSIILGIIIGILIFAFILFLIRDILISRFLENVTMGAVKVQNEEHLNELRDAIKHDMKIDLQILLDNKQTVEALLNLDFSFNKEDSTQLQEVLSLLNTRISKAKELGLLIDVEEPTEEEEV